MTRIRRAGRLGYWVWVCSRPNPRDLKSENMGSMPQRSAYPRVVRYPGLADMAMIQGSACPGSRMMPMLVVTRWPVRATASKEWPPDRARPPVVVFCCAPAGEEIALEPQAIVPPAIATPPD